MNIRPPMTFKDVDDLAIVDCACSRPAVRNGRAVVQGGKAVMEGEPGCALCHGTGSRVVRVKRFITLQVHVRLSKFARRRMRH
jgi:hypothetical protein